MVLRFLFLAFGWLSLAAISIAEETTETASPSAPETEVRRAEILIVDPFSDPLIQEIHALHQESEGGDKKATKVLVARLEELTAAHPENFLLLSYLGSAYTLASRDAFPGPSKFSYLKNGLKTMDQAVDSSPDDCAVRFIRAVNNYHLPAFINRRDNAREDFVILVNAIDSNPRMLAPETRQAIYYFAGLSYKQTKKKDEAKKAWGKGLALNEQSELGQKMQKELGRLK